MKSFKQFVNEETMPYAGTSNGVIDVRDSAVRDNINQLLAGTTNGRFLTPYIAFERVCKTLANFHIFPPRTTFFEGDSGAVNFAINQFGFKMGQTVDGRVVTAEEDPHHVYFEYRMNDSGMFEIFCEIVDQSELEEILSDLEDEMSGETENIEELDEETIDEVVTNRKMTPKEKKARAEYLVKHKEKLAAHDTGIKAKKTVKDVKSEPGDYEKEPSKMGLRTAIGAGYYKVDEETMEEKKEKKKAKFKAYRDERDESKKKREEKLDEAGRVLPDLTQKEPEKKHSKEYLSRMPKKKESQAWKAYVKTGAKWAKPEGVKEETLSELSKSTLASYIKKASHDVATKSAATGRYAERANKEEDNRKKTGDYSGYRQGRKDNAFADKMFDKSWKRRKGIAKAADKLTKEEVMNEISAKLVGKVNKARSVGGKPSKTPAADATRTRAVVKKWLDSDVGKLKE